MRFCWSSPPLNSIVFSGEVESAWSPNKSGSTWLENALTRSVDIIQRREQRAPRGPGGNCGNQHGLRRQCQITGRAQRKRPQQRRELVADRGAGKPASDRFGETEPQHCGAAADQAAFKPKPKKMPQEAVGDVGVAG